MDSCDRLLVLSLPNKASCYLFIILFFGKIISLLSIYSHPYFLDKHGILLLTVYL